MDHRLKDDVRKIIARTPDLADLSTNAIRDALVAQYGRSWLNDNFALLRKSIKEILEEDVDKQRMAVEIDGLIEDAKKQFQ